MHRFNLPVARLVALLAWGWSSSPCLAHDYFKITVVDAQTKRGVPLVELRTTHEVRYYTDSNGVVAFLEPGLMDQDVFFTIKSHGYEFPADGFGTRGKALRTKPGGETTLEIQRLNIAQRLYRITGAGIYRDSVLTDTAAPTSQPLLNAMVSGQDTVGCYPYRGKLFWLWGDTSWPAYTLGNFSTTCATSDLPASGGLDPSLGVNLHYFTADNGFTKKMVPLDGPGPVWLDGLVTLPDESGRERLIARFIRVKDLAAAHEVGLVIFNDQKQVFERFAKFDLNGPQRDAFGHVLRHKTGGVDYLYFATPYPSMRVRADLAQVKDPKAYESFTPLVTGARYDKDNPKLERDQAGKLVYGWKPDTSPVGPGQQQELVEAKKLKPDEGYWQMRDVETAKPVRAHAGSVYYNAFRKRFVMIFHEVMGTSLLGEVWYAEADDPIGPWTTARKIVTHDNYSFYNVKHHPYFDQDGGKIIYFEGTYTIFLTGNKDPTPRYDYNQIMYRLDLSDPRLKG
ncbi:MAG: hypothetical protein WBD40_15450 [Tepidisphaeraceae bacterium]